MSEKTIDLEVFDRDAVKVKEVNAPNAGAAVRLENLEFPYEGKAYLKVTTRRHSDEKVESPYALELTRVGDDAPAAASDKAAPAPAGDTAPVQPSTSTSGGSPVMLIGLGVVGIGVLVAGAYLLGRRR